MPDCYVPFFLWVKHHRFALQKVTVFSPQPPNRSDTDSRSFRNFEEKTGGHRAADSALRRCAETPFVFGPPPSSVGPTLAMALLAMDKLRRWPSPERVNPP